jgi:16S rRNA processing protein RimM
VKREDAIVIGEIVGVHGIKGQVKVRSYAESPAIFTPDSDLWLGEADGELMPHRVLQVLPHKRVLLMRFEGVADRDGAEALVGRTLHMPKEALPALDEDTYYRFELMGLDVFNETDLYLGRIEAIMETGSNDVLVVKDPADPTSGERLIPALASVVVAVDLEARRVRVKLPDGL